VDDASLILANSMTPYVILLALLTIGGCRAPQVLPSLLPLSDETIEALEIKHESYVAVDSMAFLSMRSHWGRLLDVEVDSAFMSIGEDTLICYGRVSDNETRQPLKGVHVWAGRVWKEEASVRKDNRIKPSSIPLYYMYPGVQSSSDETGHFELRAPLVGNTYLALFDQGYFAKLYEVALLMPDSVRLRLTNPGAVMQGGRM
jgi:hypothetical protein